MPIDKMPLNEAKLKEFYKTNTNEENFYKVIPQYDLDDIVLSKENLDEIEEFISFYKNRELIFQVWNLGKVIKNKESMADKWMKDFERYIVDRPAGSPIEKMLAEVDCDVLRITHITPTKKF